MIKKKKIKPINVEMKREYLKDPERMRILRNIENSFGQDSVELYKAALFAYDYAVPARQMLVAHCLNELINSIIRIDKTEIEKDKEEFRCAIINLKFVKNAEWTYSELEKKINTLWNIDNNQGAAKLLRKELTECKKIKRVLDIANAENEFDVANFNNNAEESKRQQDKNAFEAVSDKVLDKNEREAKKIHKLKQGKLQELRHFNVKLNKISEEELKKCFDAVEEFLCILTAHNEEKFV